MHIIRETGKQLLQASLVYGFLVFWCHDSQAALCVSPTVIYTATSSGGANTNARTVLRVDSAASPETCTYSLLEGAEYTNLVKNRIDTANINITTLQTNQTTLQNNLATVNTGLQAATTTNTNQQAQIDLLNTKVTTSGLRDENNFLHINHEDSLTLFYAVMGLFVTAFVWRFVRNSINVADSPSYGE